ncbi:hypothetical protein [Methylobacterium oryzisoli]|uniref:hypothetical protein n=1 Tax=Methylobacterium oryzisoli TaxID=3385502 RepID=UPI0038928BCA
MSRALLPVLALSLLAGPALAKPRPKAEAAAPPNLQASHVETYGVWNVYVAGEGKARICYAITQPRERLLKSLKDTDAFLFVTVRKGERASNEIALMMGFPLKPGTGQAGAQGGTETVAATGAVPAPASAANDPSFAIDRTRYGLVVKGTNAWLQNPADEGRAVADMGRAKKVTVKAVSQRGNASTDEYSLDGFGEAMKRTREECK